MPKSNIKRILSALLVLVMVLSMVPLTALATEDTAQPSTQSRADEIREAIKNVDIQKAIELQRQRQQSKEKKMPKRGPVLAAETYPNEENDGHTHNEVFSDREPALCEDPGMTAGTYCSLCGVTLSGREEIPALGHNIQQYDAKNPTYSGVGWEAYEECSRCGYTTYVEIPMLETPAIQDYDTFMMYLMIIEDIANAYVMENPGKVYSTKALYEAVWQEAALDGGGAVAVHIRHLREKIEIDPSAPRYLKVVWGQGYKMEGGK